MGIRGLTAYLLVIAAMLLAGCGAEQPIVIKPAGDILITVAGSQNNPLAGAKITLNYLRFDPATQSTVPPTPFTLPATALEDTGSSLTDNNGQASFFLPRNGKYTTSEIAVVKTDYGNMYGFLTGPEVKVDMVTTVTYEMIAYSYVPVSIFSPDQVNTLLKLAYSVIDKNTANFWLNPNAPLNKLRTAYQNALASDAGFINALITMAQSIGPEYDLFSYLPYQRFNAIPKITNIAPTQPTPVVTETNILAMNVSGFDSSGDNLFYTWVKSPTPPVAGVITNGTLLKSEVLGNSTSNLNFSSSYDTDPWYQSMQDVYVTAIVSDGGKAVMQVWGVNVLNKEQAPNFTTTPSTLFATEDSVWTYTPAASSPDGAPVLLKLLAPFPTNTPPVPPAAGSDIDMCITDTFYMSNPPAGYSAFSNPQVWHWQWANTPCSTPNLIVWRPNNCQSGPILSPQTVNIQATDAAGAVGLQSVQVTIADINHDPVITSAPANLHFAGPVTWTYQPTISDAEADSAAYPGIISGTDPAPYVLPGGRGCADRFKFMLTQAPFGATVDSDTGAISWLPDGSQVGANNFVMQVIDGHGGYATQAWTIVVDDINTCPTFTTTCSGTADESALGSPKYVCQLTATQWTLNSKLQLLLSTTAIAPTVVPRPPTLQFSPMGWAVPDPITNTTTWTITWDPTDNDTPNSWWMNFVACNDGEGGKYAPLCSNSAGCMDYVYRLDAPKRDIAPVFSSTPPVVVLGGNTYTYTAQVQDDNTNPPDTISFTLTAPNPAGASTMTKVDGTLSAPLATTTLTWPVNNTTDLGFHTVTLKANDNSVVSGGPRTMTQTWSIFVQESNYVPYFSTVGPTAGQNGVTYTYSPVCKTNAKTAPNKNLSFSLLSGPSGMSIDPKTGVVTWTPTSAQSLAGAASYTISCNSAKGTPPTSIQQTTNVTLNFVNQPPTWVSVAPLTVPVNQPLTVELIATDPDGNNVMISASTLPVGSNFTTSAGSATFSWTPGYSDVGTKTIIFTAVDDYLPPKSADLPVQITVVNQPVFQSHPVVHSNPGGSYRYEVHCLDASGKGINFSLDSPPSGMTVSPLSGNTAAAEVKWNPSGAYVGNQTINLRATDGNGNTTIQSYVINVTNNPINNPPIIVDTSPSPLQPADPVIATEGLNAGYSLIATDPEGDTLHYAFYWDGYWVFDGGPTYSFSPSGVDAGDHVLTMTVTDGASSDVSTSLNIHVRDTLPVLGAQYQFPSDQINGLVLDKKNGMLMVALKNSFATINETSIADGPVNSVAIPFTAGRMALRTNFADPNAWIAYFAKNSDILNAPNNFFNIAQDTFSVSLCDYATCWGNSFAKGFAYANGSSAAYVGATDTVYFIKSSARRYIGRYTGSIAQADIDLGAGASANAVVYDSMSDKIFVSVGGSLSQIAVIAPSTNTVTATIPLGGSITPSAMYLNSFTDRLYVYGTGGATAYIIEILAATNAKTSSSAGLPRSAVISADPSNIMVGNDTDNILYLTMPDQGIFTIYDINSGSAHTMPLAGGSDQVVFDPSTGRVTGASFSQSLLFQTK